MRAKGIITSAAARNEKGKRRAARKEPPVSPQSEKIQIPEGLHLERRPTCSPGPDERPTLRTRDRQVMAVVEVWRPEMAN